MGAWSLAFFGARLFPERIRNQYLPSPSDLTQTKPWQRLLLVRHPVILIVFLIGL